ncbi:MAG: nucleotide exchange factor GrpE [Hyphomicrobium sp.]
MSDEKNQPPQQPQATSGERPKAASQGDDLAGLEGLIGPEQLREMISALQGELDKKTAELASKQDQYVRAVAEMENVRRRLEKEKVETARYAISKFAKDILTVGDNFQRAIAAVPQEAVAADPALKSLLDGVVLAERDYRGALERHGVKPIEPTGHAFDPHFHQAVMERDDATVPSGTVLQVYQIGYLLDDRCLRPAMVVVSRGGPKVARPAETAPSEPPPANDG